MKTFFTSKNLLYAFGALVLTGVVVVSVYFSNGSLYKGALPNLGQPSTNAVQTSSTPPLQFSLDPSRPSCTGSPNPATLVGTGSSKHVVVTWSSHDPTNAGKTFTWVIDNVLKDGKSTQVTYTSSGTKSALLKVGYGPDDEDFANCSVTVVDAQATPPATVNTNGINTTVPTINPPSNTNTTSTPLPTASPSSPIDANKKKVPVVPSNRNPLDSSNSSDSGATSSQNISTDCSMFKDLKQNDPDCAAIGYMNSIGAMTGNPDGTFKPNAFLQRDQVAKIILMTFHFELASCGAAPFGDVAANAWSYQYVCTAASSGVVTGYQSGPDKGYYRPSRNVSRAEFLALLLRSLGDTVPSSDQSSYEDVRSGQWYSGYAKYSKDHGLFPGSTLNPGGFTTRREVARIIYQLYLEGKVW